MFGLCCCWGVLVALDLGTLAWLIFNMSNTTTTQQSYTPLSYEVLLIKYFTSPLGIGLLVVIVIMMILTSYERRSQKPRLSDGRWANQREIKACFRKGRKQEEAQVFNNAALFIGSDRRFYIPDASASIGIYGMAGIGKTASFISPLIESAQSQGMSLIILDAKGTLKKLHAASLLADDYRVGVLAPGKPYSDSINYLDFMTDHLDSGMASQAGRTLNRSSGDPSASRDGFFGPQGDDFLKVMFMLGKYGPHKDFLAVWKILSLSNLPDRLKAAKKYKNIDPWLFEVIVAIEAAGLAPETLSGILLSGITHFQSLMAKNYLPFTMETTVPLDLTGRQAIFFEPDLQRMGATVPLIAMAIHLLIMRNIDPAKKRVVPLVFVADEIDLVYMADLKTYTTLLRELGLITILSFQSDKQPKYTFGADYAAATISSCTTRVTMNPNDYDTESLISRSLGDRQIDFKSRSSNTGQGGGSQGLSDHSQVVPLCPPEEIHGMAQGEAIIQSLSYVEPTTPIESMWLLFTSLFGGPRTKAKQARAWRGMVPYSKVDAKARQRCKEVWESILEPEFIKNAQARMERINLELAIEDREVMAEAMFPSSAVLEALHIQNSQPAPEPEKDAQDPLIVVAKR
jgi:type IV secretion system protein VirD4